MNKFSSTLLVQDNSIEEIRKADLDLLDKINSLSDSAKNTTKTSDILINSRKVKKLLAKTMYTGNGVQLENGDVVTFGQKTGAGTPLFNGAPITESIYSAPFILQTPPGETGSLVKIEMYIHGGAALYSTGNFYTSGYNTTQLLTGSTPMLTLVATEVVDFRIPTCLTYQWQDIRIWILKTDNWWYSTGYNTNGACGDGTTTHVSTFKRIVTDVRELWNFACDAGSTWIQKLDGSLWACGYNGNGQLGDGTTGNSLSFKNVSAAWGVQPTDIVQSVTGGFGYYDAAKYVTCTVVMLISGRVRTCGYGAFCTLGDGTTVQKTTPVSPLNVPNNIIKLQVAGGSPASCFALTSTGDLWTWGYNSKGQLGRNSTTDQSTPAIVATNVRDVFFNANAYNYSYNGTSYLQLNDGTVKAAGYSPNGQMADGTYTQKNVYTSIPWNLSNGKLIDVSWNGYGDGGYYSLFLTDTGKCFGVGYNGRQGLSLTGESVNKSVLTEMRF